jgi:hypothetical protein
MNTAKVYKDIEGNDCTIHQMIKREPDWAANIIQYYEKEVTELRAEVERLNQPFQPDWVNYRQGKIDGLLVAAEYLFCNKHIDRDTYEAIKAKAEGV